MQNITFSSLLLIWVWPNWSPFFCAIATQICLALAQPVGEIKVKRGKTSHRYKVFTINYALQQHIPQLKTEQSAQGEEMLEKKIQWLLLNQGRNPWQMRGARSLPPLSRSHPCRADLRHTTPQKSIRLPSYAHGNATVRNSARSNVPLKL